MSFQYLESNSWNQVILLATTLVFSKWGSGNVSRRFTCRGLFYSSILITVLSVPDTSACVSGPWWLHAETPTWPAVSDTLDCTLLEPLFPPGFQATSFSPFFLLWLFFLNLPFTCEVKVAQSCPTLCDPMDYTVRGILQTRILEWVAFPFSRGSSQPGDQTQVSCIAGGFFTSWATREAVVAKGLVYAPSDFPSHPERQVPLGSWGTSLLSVISGWGVCTFLP